MRHKANKVIWAIMKEKKIHLRDLAIMCNITEPRMSKLMQTEMSAGRQLYIVKKLYGVDETSE